MTESVSGPVRPSSGPGRLFEVTPQSAGWEHLAFSVVEVVPGSPWSDVADGRETAIVPLSGAGRVTVDGNDVDLTRSSVFEHKPHIVYVPPGRRMDVTTIGAEATVMQLQQAMDRTQTEACCVTRTTAPMINPVVGIVTRSHIENYRDTTP